MYHLLPYGHFSIQTRLSVEEAAKVLSEHVSPKPSWMRRLWARRGGFEGVVRRNKFRINSVSAGRNSFLPYLWGRIEPTKGGSIVRVLISLHPFSVALSLAIAASLLFLVVRSFIEFTHDQNAAEQFYCFLGLIIVFYALVMVSFWPAAKAAQRFIAHLYQEQKVDMTEGSQSVQVKSATNYKGPNNEEPHRP